MNILNLPDDTFFEFILPCFSITELVQFSSINSSFKALINQYLSVTNSFELTKLALYEEKYAQETTQGLFRVIKSCKNIDRLVLTCFPIILQDLVFENCLDFIRSHIQFSNLHALSISLTPHRMFIYKQLAPNIRVLQLVPYIEQPQLTELYDAKHDQSIVNIYTKNTTPPEGVSLPVQYLDIDQIYTFYPEVFINLLARMPELIWLHICIKYLFNTREALVIQAIECMPPSKLKTLDLTLDISFMCLEKPAAQIITFINNLTAILFTKTHFPDLQHLTLHIVHLNELKQYAQQIKEHILNNIDINIAVIFHCCTAKACSNNVGQERFTYTNSDYQHGHTAFSTLCHMAGI